MCHLRGTTGQTLCLSMTVSTIDNRENNTLLFNMLIHVEPLSPGQVRGKQQLWTGAMGLRLLVGQFHKPDEGH